MTAAGQQTEFTESPRRNEAWEDSLSALLPAAEELWNRILMSGGTDGKDGLDAGRYTLAGIHDGDGSSTISAALAYYLAQGLGLRVLLVEADLQTPSLEYDGIVPDSPGLVGVLQNEIDFREVILELTRVGFWVLPAGDPPMSPSSVLSESGLTNLTNTLRPYFDVILFDSAPLSTATEARHLVKICNSTIPVMRSGRTLAADAAHWLEQIEEYGGKVGAVCMNDVTTPMPTWLRGLF